MKKYFVWLFFILFFVGCFNKEFVSISGYKSTYANKTLEKDITIRSIQDKRKDKYVAYIIDDNKVDKKFKLSIKNLTSWYKDAILQDIYTAHLTNKANSGIYVDIEILELKSTYDRWTLNSKTLKGNIKIKVIIEKNDTKLTREFNIKDNRISGIMLDAQSFEEYIYELLAKSVAKTTQNIVDNI